MFATDFERDFYALVRNQRVLVLVNPSADALCACKIIQYLFKCDEILYTLVSVFGIDDLKNAFIAHCDQIRHVLLVNCGASLNLFEELDIPESLVVFVCDSHRPVDVSNVYDLSNIRLIISEKESRALKVPDYDTLFRQDDKSDSESENDGDEMSDDAIERRRRRRQPEYLEKRRELRLWRERRMRTLFEYSQFTCHGRSAALTFFELAWKMSRDTNDLLWWAILGVTDQYVFGRISWDNFFQITTELNNHVNRHNHSRTADESKASVECLRLFYGEKTTVSLLNHWTLYDSFSHSYETSCKFRVWTAKGESRLRLFFAELGVPLTQATQNFSALDGERKSEIPALFQKHMSKHGFADVATVSYDMLHFRALEPRDLFIATFTAKYGYRSCYHAKDVVLACSALLEMQEGRLSLGQRVERASDCLDRSTGLLEEGIQLAKKQLHAIGSQMQLFLKLSKVWCIGPFLIAIASGHELFCQPLTLTQLARYTLNAFVAGSQGSVRGKSRRLPLVLFVGCPAESRLQGHSVLRVIGIPPLSEELGRNFFGQAFEQAATASSVRMIMDNFDSNIVEIPEEDKVRFVDALVNALR